MDPDAALKEMRALVEEVLNDDDPSEDSAERMSELFDGLDGWISKGGFLPQDWQR